MFFAARDFSTAQINAEFDALKRTGVTLARCDALWETAEPAPPVGGVHTYHWEFGDLVAGTLARYHLKWLPIVDYAPAWASADPHRVHVPPRDPADFSAFAAALAGRYGRNGTYWRTHPNVPAQPVDTFEIWNEPDSSKFWAPAPDFGRYAALYLQSRAAIRAVDPSAQVIVGGLAYPQSSIARLLSSSPALGKHTDGVGIHPYAPNPTAVIGLVRNARAELDSAGLPAIPLYITEYGWTTSPKGAQHFVSEASRPAFINATTRLMGDSNCGVATVIIHTWVTLRRRPGDPEDWFGLEGPSAGPSPDADAFAAAVSSARSSRTVTSVC